MSPLTYALSRITSPTTILAAHAIARTNEFEAPLAANITPLVGGTNAGNGILNVPRRRKRGALLQVLSRREARGKVTKEILDASFVV